ISNNTSLCAAGGGGILNNGNLSLVRSTLSGNRAIFGGALYSVTRGAASGPGGASATLVDSQVSGNIALGRTLGGPICGSGVPTEFGGVGGGIASIDAALTIVGSTIANNTAAGSGTIGPWTNAGGGGIFSDGRLSVARSTISGNTLQSAAGGGVYYIN